MLSRSSCRLQTIGFYVAQHPWLKAAGFVKVGYSTCLETRLDMASFKTCFTPEWYYASVFECKTSEDALLLEQSVLFCLSEKRVDHRELIRLSEDEVIKKAAVLAHQLCLSVVQRMHPHYQGTLARTLSAKPQQPSFEHTLMDMKPIVTDEERDAAPLSPAAVSTTIAPYREVLDRVKADMGKPHPPLHQNVYATGTEAEEDEECLSSGDFSFLSTLIDRNDYSLDMLRPYQQEAVACLVAELSERKKAVCQMACRCGKTPVAYQIIQRTLQESGSGRVLYLVPGLSLLRQTVRKLVAYGLQDTQLLLIGSDPLPVMLSGDKCQLMTTNPDVIRQTILGNPKVVVVSTYHSSPLLKELNIFQLTVFDECHRVCGSAADTAFNTVLKLPLHGQRLFLTATPTYDTPIKMSDTGYFGGIAYRYYLREGINDGYVNSFCVRVVLGGSLSHMNPYIFEAMRMVDKMLVFCRDIAHAVKMYEELIAETPPSDVAAYSVLMAHSRMGSAAVANALHSFTTAKRCVLLNVRLFQEGVEIPDLNAVFFAAPRYSSRDIIQSICRPLNRLDGKPPSFVFLPAVYECKYAADHPINLQSFSTLIPFTDALMDEDPTLFEYMIDPQKKSYDIDVVGVRSLRLTSEKLQRFVLPAIRRGVRYSTRDTDRLHRAARFPWKSIFAEMKRIVHECNRYPKTNDAWVVGGTQVSMNMFYQYVRRGYKLYERGEPTYLQVHQLRDLESLPRWKQYGVHGPYPWKECLETLERHLRVHKRVPPLDVHKGGYIGLDATPFERLAGCLMHVNQADSRLQIGLSPEKQADLDRLCAPYKLRWRKRRTASGSIVKNDVTMITESYMKFKKLFEKADEVEAFQKYIEVHFPGYPHKHARMETLDNLRRGIVPPRRSHQPQQEKKGKRLKGRQVASAATKEATVMCRICRTHVSVSNWESHLSSKEHVRAQKTLP
ncbi:helicase-like protein [Leishmania tarentolae]|uniref:Probable helicase A859L n=1 Tax=Leishmania tarentolae TaxID=5689 RepID=A0A640KPK6_LEITA|nr:helicase-like protein [Leishmania tarentolae]